jgi:hypothetical protein
MMMMMMILHIKATGLVLPSLPIMIVHSDVFIIGSEVIQE